MEQLARSKEVLHTGLIWLAHKAIAAHAQWSIARQEVEPLYKIPKDLRPHARYLMHIDSFRESDERTT